MKKQYSAPSMKAYTVDTLSILANSDTTGQIPVTDKPYPSKAKSLDLDDMDELDDESELF